MKKKVSYALMLVILVTTCLIAGCLPPNYSNEKAKDIAKTHHKDAVEWFRKNMPDATPNKDCEAYATGVDLLGAVRGSYKRNGKTYKYVYEYTDSRMYVSDGYDETCKIVEDMVLKDFGYSKKETEVSFHGYKFKAKNENDTPRNKLRGDEAEEPKEILSYQEKLMPAELTPEEFAKSILAVDTKEYFDFYLHLYTDDFVAPQIEKIKKYKNLGSVWCNKKIDLANETQGVFEKVYLRNKIKENYYHVEKITEGIYGGYIAFNGKPAKGDKLKIKHNANRLTLEIPEGTYPVIFSKKAMTLVHSFKNTKGELIENVADEMFRRKIADINGYHQYDTNLFVKDDFSYGYKSISVPLVRGVYEYKILGIFDLDYWRLKFFD